MKRKRNNFFIVIFLLIFQNILLNPVFSEPWSSPESDHPVTLDVQRGEISNYIFTNKSFFPAGKIAGRSVYPFDMLIDFYRKHITTLNGVTCRYYPTCSHYAGEAIRKFGIITGMIIGAERLMRCHEYQTDDMYDPVVLW